MAKLNKEVAVLFRTQENTKRKFDSCVKLHGKNNKEVFELFMLKFITNSDEALKFLGIKIA